MPVRCCVIGGAGFLGAHLVAALLRTGREVLVIGRRDPQSIALAMGVTYLQGDIKNREFITHALAQVDEVVDLAYASVPKTSFENPIDDIVDNLPASVTLFDVASNLKLRKMVFVSSGGTVYGEALQTPIAETHPTNPISPYGISKLALEKYAQLYHRMRQLPIVCVRPANPYGEGQKPHLSQGFIATAMASIIEGKTIQIFGETGAIRDYVYAQDVAEALVCALDHGVAGAAYNIGSAIGRSNIEVLDAIAAVASASGFHARIQHIAARPFDVSTNILDTKKLRTLTGWKPKIGFTEGIARTWEWHLQNSYKRPAGVGV